MRGGSGSGGGDQTPLHPLEAAPVGSGDLVLAVGHGRVLSHAIDRDEIVIGRDPDCDFAIEHPALSRRHAVLRPGAPSTIRDLGSTNGTQIDGRLVRGGEPVALHGPAGFAIGPFAFVVVARRDGAPISSRERGALRVEDPTLAGATPLVREFAATDASVLITGETGVGKEVLAHTLHALSGRRGEFVSVNCAALAEHLLESELFGYERGAFTGAQAPKRGLFEAAAHGTLLLDEIGELPLAVQAKLLRALERREVRRLGATRAVAIDVRFVAATNRDLAAEVARGAFRADLFYRLDGVTLAIPPLRERTYAIAPLALKLLEAARPRAPLSADVIAALEAHPWPGNVRELKAVIERAAVLAGTGPITVRHLAFTRTMPPELEPLALDPEQQADRTRVVEALERCAGNQTRAAQLLGISRTTIITKLRIYKIPRPTVRSRGATSRT